MVITTLEASSVSPAAVAMPRTALPSPPASSSTRSSTLPWKISRLGVAASSWRIASRYRSRSAWARGPRTAGPLREFKTLKWMPAWSMIRPMTPSKASISRTRWPLPMPPIEGLQDISPTVSTFWVTSTVLAPVRALAAAASHPAWPPPTIITS